jgi:hypothetical protein
MAETKNAQTPDPKSNQSTKPSPKPNLSALPFLSNANALPFSDKSKGTTLPDVTVTATRKKPNLGSLMKRIKTAQDATDAELNALGQYATRYTKYDRELINKQFEVPTAPNTITNTREAVEKKRKDNLDKAAQLKVVDDYDAINNTLEAYLKKEKSSGRNYSTTFNPSTGKFEDIDPYSHPSIIEKRKELEYGLKTGQFELDKDELTGMPVLFSTYDDPLYAFNKALDKSAIATYENKDFLTLSTEEKVKQTNYENTVGPAYLPQKAVGYSKPAKFLGDVTLPLLKATVYGMGAMTLGKLNPAWGATMSAEVAASLNKLGSTLSFVEDMSEANASSAIKIYYNNIMKNNPTMDPIVAMKDAEKQAITGAATGAAEAILMGTSFSKFSKFKGIEEAATKVNTAPFLKSMLGTSKKALKEFVPVVKEATKIGTISAAGAATRDAVANISGADISAEETTQRSITAFEEGFKMVAGLGIVPAAARGARVIAETIPYVRDVNTQNIKYAIAVATNSIPGIQPSVFHQAKLVAYEIPEIDSLIKAGETEGVFEQGTLEKFKSDRKLYEETDSQVPTDIPKEKRDIIRGIQVKLNKLDKMSKGLKEGSPFLDRVNKMIEQLDNKAVEVLESDNPIEVDTKSASLETKTNQPQEITLESLKDFGNLPNVEWAVKGKQIKVSEFGVNISGGNETLKSAATTLSQVEGPYQAIFKAIANMPKSDRVKISSMPLTRNPITGGWSGGIFKETWLFRKPEIQVLLNETRGGNAGINEYSILAHEAMHWVTIDSINKYKNTSEYRSLFDIYDFVQSKKSDRIRRQGFEGNNYGLANFNEFMAELLVDKDFRDGISDVMIKDKAELEKYVIDSSSSLDSNADLITILVNYVKKVIKDLMNSYGSGKGYENINFDKSMLDNSTELAIKAFFENPVSRKQGIDLNIKKQETFPSEGPINEQNKPIENATPIGQEPAKEISTEGNIGEPTGIEGVKNKETPQANVGDSNIGGKAKPKVEAPKLEVEPEKETPKEFNNNETATVFGKMKKAAEEYLSKKADDFSGASRKALSTLKNSAFYKGLDKNEREKYVSAAAKFFEGKRPPSPTIQRILGTANDAKTTVNNMAALKTQLRLQAKAAKDAEMWIKGTRKSISNGLNELKKKGVIKTSQFLSILKKYDSLNMANKDAIDNFTSYVTKIVNDANYNDKLKTATRFNSLIKKASKMKGKQANLVSAAKEFLGIDPKKVENIDEYIEKANIVLNGVRSSRIKGLEVNFSDAFKGSDILEYAKGQKSKIEEAKKQSKLEDYNDLVESGEISSDMSFDEISQIIGEIEQGNESGIPNIENKSKEIRAYINKRFDSISAEVKSMLDRSIDPFTGVRLSDISDADRSRLSKIIDMGLNDLPLKEAYNVVEALNNFAVNGKASNLDSAIAISDAYSGAREITGKGIKSLTIKGIFGKRAARAFAADFTSFPVLFDKAFGANRSLAVQKAMGLSSLQKNSNMAEKIHQKAIKEYSDKFLGKLGGTFKTKVNPNGMRFDATENIYERGMLSVLRRNMGGDEASVAKEFARRKSLLEQSIKVLREKGGDDAKMADVYESIFNKIAKDSKNISEVESKADHSNLEANNWWINEYGKHYDKMRDVSLNIYNQELGYDNNYIPDVYDKFDKSEVESNFDPLKDNPFFAKFDYIPKVKSGSLMKTTNPETLPNGKFINLDFDYNNNKALKSALVNIYTAKDLKQVEAFRDSPYFDKIFNKEDGKVFKGKISTYAKKIQNRDISEFREFNELGRSLSVAATTAVSSALSSVAQPVKQLAPAVHTLIATNGRLAISDALNPSAHSFIDRIGYGISNRGMSSQVSMESISSMLKRAEDGALARGIRTIGKVQEAKLKIFVGYSDIFTARMSWLSFYKEALRKKGEDVSNIDWDTHKVNNDAAAYAEQMVDVSQNVSDTNLQGRLIGSNDPYHKAFKNMVMTLANYTINQKAKIGGNIRVALGKGVSAEDRALSIKSLSGTAAEMFVYNAIWQMASNIQWGIADKMSNTTPSQEEKRRRALSSKRTTITNLVNDIVSPHPIFNDGLDKMANAVIDQIDPNTPQAFKVRLYDGGGADAFAKNYGVGGILIKTIMDASKYSDVAISGEVKTEDPFGEEQIKTLTKEDKKIAMSWLPLTVVGRALGFSDIANVSNKIIKNLSARGMSEENALVNEAVQEIPAEEGKQKVVDNRTINQAAAEAVKFKDPESRAKYLLDLKDKYGDDAWSKEIDLISSPKAGIIDGGTIAFMSAMANNDQDALKVYRAFSLAKPEAKVESLMRTKQEIGSDRFFKKVRSILDFKMLNADAILLFADKLEGKELDKFIKIYSEFSKKEQEAAAAEEEAKRIEEEKKAALDALGTEQ